jgi:uncharacterized membrane protein
MDADSPGCLPFLAAATGAAITASVWFELELTILVFPVALIIAAVHIAFLGAPIYLWLQSRYRPTLGAVLLAGTLIGALPISLALAPTAVWREAVVIAAMCGSCGFVGGLAFWLVLAFRSDQNEERRPG